MMNGVKDSDIDESEYDLSVIVSARMFRELYRQASQSGYVLTESYQPWLYQQSPHATKDICLVL